MTILLYTLIPLLGTILGAAFVLFTRGKLNSKIEKILLGFSSGVMIAASIWSLIIPGIEMSEDLGKLSFLPVSVGFGIGIIFLLLMDMFIPHLHVNSDRPEGKNFPIKKTTKLLLAVTIHNIPEGMAVGVILAGAIYGNSLVTTSGAIALCIGIAIQNIPEGAIISMPLNAEGMSKPKSFLFGVLSGVVEPIAAVLTALFAQYLLGIIPYLLGFAAGAMVYVVVEDLIPSAHNQEHSHLATIALAVGFVIMMILDIVFG